MADLNTDVRYIKGIGEQRAKALGKLGIATLRDLISYFPRAYDDRSALRRIADLVPGRDRPAWPPWWRPRPPSPTSARGWIW